jgi:hypothetical protein
MSLTEDMEALSRWAKENPLPKCLPEVPWAEVCFWRGYAAGMFQIHADDVTGPHLKQAMDAAAKMPKPMHARPE